IIYSDKEAYWHLRGAQKWVLKGDANTAYFQAIANGRRRRDTIPLLWDGPTLLQSRRDIRSHVDGFYRSLFATAPRSGLSLAQDCWTGRQLVTDAENAARTDLLSEGEVWAAIKGMNPTSAPGPDGLPVKFFQAFWNVIKPEVMAIFDEFYIGSIDLGRLNYGTISLIPKVPGASDIRQFRPIMV
uniref:Reverse transcriptase domain-containing protein n=1 Tax=Aegilops tauschii subsp. strangulata TaxID=200361 RepID=A0A453BG03_AEGTS